MEEVIDRCKGLSIEEEEDEDEGFEDIQGGEPEQEETTKWVLVGRFLTDHMSASCCSSNGSSGKGKIEVHRSGGKIELLRIINI